MLAWAAGISIATSKSKQPSKTLLLHLLTKLDTIYGAGRHVSTLSPATIQEYFRVQCQPYVLFRCVRKLIVGQAVLRVHRSVQCVSHGDQDDFPTALLSSLRRSPHAEHRLGRLGHGHVVVAIPASCGHLYLLAHR